MRRTGKGRLRFYGVASDQIEVILAALAIARSEINTTHDTVALEAICTYFVSTFQPHATKDMSPSTGPHDSSPLS